MNINLLMKQAQQMQNKLKKVQKQFEEKVFEFESTDHLIKGKMKGNLELISIEIDPQLLIIENKDVLQDLITITLNQIRKTIVEQKEKEIGSITGNVAVPTLI